MGQQHEINDDARVCRCANAYHDRTKEKQRNWIFICMFFFSFFLSLFASSFRWMRARPLPSIRFGRGAFYFLSFLHRFLYYAVPFHHVPSAERKKILFNAGDCTYNVCVCVLCIRRRAVSRLCSLCGSMSSTAYIRIPPFGPLLLFLLLL